MYVNEAMSTSVKCCKPDSNLHEIAQRMWEEDCGSIPIVDDANKPLGVVTDRDIAMCAMLNGKPLWEISAATVIEGQQPQCCSQTETLERCLDKMKDAQVRRILVTDDAGSLCGIVSMGDAVSFTWADGSARKSSQVKPDHTVGMLRQVSQHHENINELVRA